MELQLIRNATLRLIYHDHLILIDPCLAPRHAFRSFAGMSRNPTVDLPLPPEQVIDDVDWVIVSHLHPDHFEEVAEDLLPWEILLFCQPEDAETIGEMGFTNVHPLADSTQREGIGLTRTPARHGEGAMAERLGPVSGFLFRADGEPTVYWMGDTVWYREVATVIAREKPDVIITHSSGAVLGDSAPIIMDARQTVAVCEAAPEAVVVAVHLDALDHGTVSRATLRAAAEAAGIGPERLLIPADGERLDRLGE